MTALITLTAFAVSFYFWLCKRNAESEKTLLISEMSLWKSKCVDFVRLDLKQKVLDSTIFETCKQLSNTSDNYFHENLTILYEHRIEVSLENMAIHMGNTTNKSPSLDDHIAVTDSVFDEMMKACLDLIVTHKQIAANEAEGILLSLVEESRNNHVINLLQGNWSSPKKRFHALMYGQNHPLAEPILI